MKILRLSLLLALLGVLPLGATAGSSLSFQGNGVGQIDRVKILVDDPATALPGPPADVGATDFTLELWLRGRAAENPAAAVVCGDNDNWIFGHVVLDRDRFSARPKFGLSIAGNKLVFGITGADGFDKRTFCSTSTVLDSHWHHVAVTRRRSDGFVRLFVDGALQASGDGPDGDLSYADDDLPSAPGEPWCPVGVPGVCEESDPFLVLGAEKHDAGSTFPSFAGRIDEVRLSTTERYTAPFSRPAAPFVADGATAALYTLDEGSGDVVGDSSGAVGGPSPGVRAFGGSPAGPWWSGFTPFGNRDGFELGDLREWDVAVDSSSASVAEP